MVGSGVIPNVRQFRVNGFTFNVLLRFQFIEHFRLFILEWLGAGDSWDGNDSSSGTFDNETIQFGLSKWSESQLRILECSVIYSFESLIVKWLKVWERCHSEFDKCVCWGCGGCGGIRGYKLRWFTVWKWDALEIAGGWITESGMKQFEGGLKHLERGEFVWRWGELVWVGWNIESGVNHLSEG